MMSDLTTPSSSGESETDWVLLRLAHAEIPAQSRALWNTLVIRYEEPVRRLLHYLVRDPHVEDDLYQEFWVRFLRGDFANATAERGRFRNLLRTALSNLVIDHYRRARRRGNALGGDVAAPGSTVLEELCARQTEFWRLELAGRTMNRLKAECGETGDPHADILTIESACPDKNSSEKAIALSERLGRPIKSDHYRQLLHRAREQFVTLLIEEVRRGLVEPSMELVQEELAELRLLEFCGLALPSA